MEDEDEIEKALPAKIIEKKMIEVKPSGSQIINTGQRQIIMGPNNQVILSPNQTHQTATIKTDSGIQSVPIIIQQPNQMMQHHQQQQSQPTQYILATNQQGQTYVVAQQPINNPPMPQTVLLAQAPGQQGQKTIIILQQPQGGQQTIQVGQQQQQQKIIMTPSGQQVIYSSQVQRHMQPTLLQQSPGTQIIQNASQATNRKIVITNAHQQGQQQGTKIVQHATSQQTLQAIAQGQNIIMQKGQKYQIGSTQITQIVNPVQQQQQQQQVSNLMTQKIISTPVTTQSAQVMIAKESMIVKQASESPVIETPPIEVQEKKHEEVVDEIKEEIDAVKAPSSQASSSSSSSGTSSPAPPTKQTISIQIPVPQSQIAGQNAQQYTIKIVPSMDPSIKVKDEDVELSWPYTCEVNELSNFS